MAISAELVKHLRQATGASMMLCKKVLEEAGGDLEKALTLLKKSSEVLASKKAERGTAAGVIEAYIHQGGRVGVLLELRCETDFVARNEEFKKLAHDIALHIAGMNPPEETAESLYSQPYVKDTAISVEEFIKRAITHFGEKIEVARFARYEV